MKDTEENLVYSEDAKVLTIKIHGEIDHHSTKKLAKSIDSHLFIKRPETLILDLSSVSFMDSSGLGLILGRYRLATELRMTFKLLNPTPSVMKILKISGCEKIIDISRKKEI